VRLYSRPGNDLAYRFPLIVETLARLRSRSCIIDGRPLPGMTMAWRRSISSGTTALTTACFLYAFDLIELDGDDLRPRAA
jgi:ATP-dependent DNA ligase